VDRGNEQVFRPPYVADETRLWIFLVKANMRKLDQAVQRYLTVPTGGALSFTAAGGWVALMLADIQRLHSGDPRDAPRGFTTEREFSIWLPVWDHRRRSPAWFVPYIFTDDPAAVTCGREVFGYPKAHATIEFDQEASQGGAGDPMRGFSIHTKAAIEYGGGYSLVPFIRAEQNDPKPQGPVNFRDAVREIHRRPAPEDPGGAKLVLSPGVGPPPTVVPQPPGFSARVKRRLPSDEVDSFLARLVDEAPLVFLKQFRDATEPTKACYQAIIEGHIVVRSSVVGPGAGPDGSAAQGMSALVSLDRCTDPLKISFVPRIDLNLAEELGLAMDPADPGSLSVPDVLTAKQRVRLDVLLGEVLWQWPH
jgi:hypothetical protein